MSSNTLELSDTVQDYLIDKNRELKLNQKQRDSIEQFLKDIEKNPSIGNPSILPVGGTFGAERHIGNFLWLTLRYDVKKYREHLRIEVTSASIHYKM